MCLTQGTVGNRTSICDEELEYILCLKSTRNREIFDVHAHLLNMVSSCLFVWWCHKMFFQKIFKIENENMKYQNENNQNRS